MSRVVDDRPYTPSIKNELHGLFLGSLNLNNLNNAKSIDARTGGKSKMDADADADTDAEQSNEKRQKASESPDGTCDPGSSYGKVEFPKEIKTRRDGFRTSKTRLLQHLYFIERDFLDPRKLLEGIEDPNWMIDGSNSSAYAKVLFQMIQKIRKLAVNTTLVYESVNPASGLVRTKLYEIVKKMSEIATLKKHSAIKPSGGGRTFNPMKDVSSQITQLRRLVHAQKTLPKGNETMVKMLTGHLDALKEAIYDDVDSKMKNELLPQWIIDINMKGKLTMQEQADKTDWITQKYTRVHEAKARALDTLFSFKELRSELNRVREQAGLSNEDDDEDEDDDELTGVAQDKAPDKPLQLAEESVMIANKHSMLPEEYPLLSAALKAIERLSTAEEEFDVEAWTVIIDALSFGYQYNLKPYDNDAISQRKVEDVVAVTEFLQSAVKILTQQDDAAKEWFAKHEYGVARSVIDELSKERKELVLENLDMFEEDTEDKYQYDRIIQASKNVIYFTGSDEFDKAELEWTRLGLGVQYMFGLYAKEESVAAMRTIKFATKVAKRLSRVNPKVLTWFETNGVLFDDTSELLNLVKIDVLKEANQYIQYMESMPTEEKALLLPTLQSVITLFSDSATFSEGDLMAIEVAGSTLKSKISTDKRSPESDMAYIIRFLERVVKLSWKRKLSFP